MVSLGAWIEPLVAVTLLHARPHHKALALIILLEQHALLCFLPCITHFSGQSKIVLVDSLFLFLLPFPKAVIKYSQK